MARGSASFRPRRVLAVTALIALSTVACARRPAASPTSNELAWTCRGRSGPLERYPFEGFEFRETQGPPSNDVLFAFHRVQPGVRACAERSAVGGVLPEGRVHVHLALDAAGSVERTCLAPEGALDEATLVCVATQLESVHVEGGTSPLTVRTVVVPSRSSARVRVNEPFSRRCDEIDVVAVGSPLPASSAAPPVAPPPPTPATGPAATFSGHHGGDRSMDAPLAASRGRIRSCYQAALNVNPDIEGSLRFELSLGDAGRVARVCTQGVGLAEPIRLCIARVLRTLRFPPPAAPTYRVTGSFSFINRDAGDGPVGVTSGTSSGPPPARDLAAN